MRKILIAVLIAAVVLTVFVLPTDAVGEASIRYINVEQITYITNYRVGFQYYNVTHFSATFALWKVNAESDRCYYAAYVIRDKAQVIVAKWSIGFSVAGGMQGVFVDSSTDLVNVQIAMAEFPYMTQTITNALDGTQDYKFYRMHFYFQGELFKTEQVTVAGDYMKDPLTGQPQTLTAMRTLSTSTTGDLATYRIIKANPQGFMFKQVHTK